MDRQGRADRRAVGGVGTSVVVFIIRLRIVDLGISSGTLACCPFNAT
jgi:hypothetical protein